jgi:hypothetical protein
MITLVNWQQEEPNSCGGGRQLSMDGTSRVNREVYARFCERLGVKFPGPTRRRSAMAVPTATSIPTPESPSGGRGESQARIQNVELGGLGF